MGAGHDFVLWSHFTGHRHRSFQQCGGSDGFIAKYTSQNTLLWVKHLGGSLDDFAYGVAVDSQDNIIVTGSFSGTADFGGTTLTDSTGTGTFVAKYSPGGSLMWAKGFAGDGIRSGTGVAVDGSGNVFVTVIF